MNQTSSHNPINGAAVGAALNQIFSPKEAKGAYSRSSTVNFVIMVSCREQFGEINHLLDALATVHPGRYFVVYCDRALKDVKVQVSARCVGLSAQEAVCSEVIMVGAAPEHMRAVPSVLRGNLLTGSPTELFLFERCVGGEAFELVAPLCDLVILDSAHFKEESSCLKELIDAFPRVVDLEWIGLGLWREQIKAVFNRQIALDLLPYLDRVEVVQANHACLSGPLLAGWILERLRAEILSGAGGVFRCRSTYGMDHDLKLSASDDASEANGIQEVAFFFNNPDWRRLSDAPTIRLRRSAGLETLVETGAGRDLTSVAFEDESWLGRLKRYYGVGESTANYRSSFKRALALLDQKG